MALRPQQGLADAAFVLAEALQAVGSPGLAFAAAQTRSRSWARTAWTRRGVGVGDRGQKSQSMGGHCVSQKARTCTSHDEREGYKAPAWVPIKPHIS